MNQPRINLHYFTYPELKALPQNRRGWACWYYYTLAMKAYEQVKDQFGTLEHEPWLTPQYEQIARSVALMYQLENPGEFMQPRFWDCVKRQAFELDLPAPVYAIMAPIRLVLPS